MRECFPESDPSADRAKAGRTGAPRDGRRGWLAKVERREAQRPPSMGARGLTVPREVGPLIPPQRVPRKHSGASRRSIALAMVRGTWQTSDALRRENAEAWLFEIVDRKPKRGAFFTSPRSSRGEVARVASG